MHLKKININNKVLLFSEILFSETELSDINFERLKRALIYMKNKFIYSDNDMYLTIFLKKVNFKPYGYDKMYMDQLNKRKINHRNFYLVLFDNMHPLYDVNGRACKILLFSNFN